MTQTVFRLLVAIIGLAGALVGLRTWMAPEEIGVQFGLSPASGLGLATLRADIAGFFAGVGLMCLVATITRRGAILIGPLMLVGLALAGRLFTVAINGFEPTMLAPMLVEAGVLAVLGLGYKVLERRV